MIDPSEWCWLHYTLGVDGCMGPIDPAHVGFSEHWLSKAPTGPHLTKEQANDPRILRPICRKHHHQFDFGKLDLTRAQLPPSVEEYAKEHGLVHKLNREYGLRTER